MDFIKYYQVKREDINKIEMILQSYENLAVFSTMDSKIAIVRIMSDEHNKQIVENILSSLNLDIKELETYVENK